MDYLAKMQEAGEGIDDLAAKVRTLEARRDEVRDRIVQARRDVERREAAIAAHKGRGGEKLSESTSKFREWQGRLGRLERELGTAKQAVEVLQRDLLPAAERDLPQARQDLRAALEAAAAAVRPEVEEKMAEMFSAIVAQHDTYLAARAAFFEQHGESPGRGGPPIIRSGRLGRDALHRRLTGDPWLELLPPPSKPEPVAATSEMET